MPSPTSHSAPLAGGSEHVAALDGVRGLAILLVIPHNVTDYDAAGGWALIPAAIARAGWIGVELFFVLSGYLITRNLLEAKGDAHYYRSFYARRVLRIVPLYYLLLALFLFLVPHLIELPQSVLDSYRGQLWFWLFLNNWVQAFGHTISWFGPCWSLAVEEQFYLLWPFVIALCPPERLLRLCALVVGAAFCARVALLAAHVDPDSIYRLTVSRMDALGAGAAVAVLARDPRALAFIRARATTLMWTAAAVLVAGAIVSRGYSLESLFTYSVCYTSIALAAAAILIVLLVPPAGRPRTIERLLSLAPLRSVGRYSYAIYLLHFPLWLLIRDRAGHWLAPTGAAAPWLLAAVIALASWLLGFVSWRCYEAPILRLKRFFPVHAA
jgi:peptidoglycan/LPS O-acetylase OafA/YrhL